LITDFAPEKVQQARPDGKRPAIEFGEAKRVTERILAHSREWVMCRPMR